MSAVVKMEKEHQSSRGTSLFNEYDDTELTIRILFGREVVNVIGKGGKTVKTIRKQSGARVMISNASTPERIVLISGNRIAICKATELIGLKVEEFFERLNGNWTDPKLPLTFKLIVPASQCGFIIGKNGSKIREIKNSSRAAILVGSDMLPNSTERLVSITGTTGTISHCVYLVCNVLLDSPPRATISYFPCSEKSVISNCTVIKDFGAEHNIPLTNHAALELGTASNGGINPAVLVALAGSQLRAGNYGLNENVGGEQYENNSSSNIETITINIPNNLIGCIIGRRGSKISEIRQASGAMVKICQSLGMTENGKNKDRCITITGNKESLSIAKYIIETSVAIQKANQGKLKLSSSPDLGSISTSSTPTETQLFAKPDPTSVISCLYANKALFSANKSPPIQTTDVHSPEKYLKRKRSPSSEKTKVEMTKLARY